MSPRSSSAHVASASGPTTQRYIVASLATISQPRASIAGISTSRFARVARACLLDVTLVVPRDDRCALHELLRRRARRSGGTPSVPRSISGGAGDEAGAVAGHRRALAQRLEDDDARAVGRPGAPTAAARRTRAPCTPRRSATTKSWRSAALRELVVELERRDRAGRVVRVVDPDERDVVVERRRDPAGSRSRAAAAASAPARRRRARRARTPDTPARRTPRRARRVVRAPARARRSPPSSRRSARSPCRGRPSTPKRRSSQPAAASRSSGRPCASGYGARSGSASIERLPDHRVGRLVRIALAEVDHVDAGRQRAAAAPPRAARTDRRPSPASTGLITRGT